MVMSENPLTEEIAEMIAVRAWSQGDPHKVSMWGVIHEENRRGYIEFTQAVARELIALGWPPFPSSDQGPDPDFT